MNDLIIAIKEAMSSNDTQEVKELIEQCPELVNELTAHALYSAISSKHTELAKFIIRKKPDLLDKPDLLGQKDKFGNTVLDLAIRSGDTEVAKFIIETRPDLLDQKDGYKNTALEEAIRSKNTKIAELIIKTRPDLLDQKTQYGKTALEEAIRSGITEIAELIIKTRLDLLDQKDGYKNTALEEAISSGDTEVAKLIIETRPDLLNQKNGFGKTALDKAISSSGNEEIAKLIIEKSNIDFADVVQQAQVEAVRRLVKYPPHEFPTRINKLIKDWGQGNCSDLIEGYKKMLLEKGLVTRVFFGDSSDILFRNIIYDVINPEVKKLVEEITSEQLYTLMPIEIKSEEKPQNQSEEKPQNRSEEKPQNQSEEKPQNRSEEKLQNQSDIPVDKVTAELLTKVNNLFNYFELLALYQIGERLLLGGAAPAVVSVGNNDEEEKNYDSSEGVQPLGDHTYEACLD